MEGYGFNVAQFISREICDREVGSEKLILVFPCLLTLIFLEMGVPKLLDIDQYIEMKTIKNMGFIRVAVKPMTR